jgi:hypothetical protein
MENCADFLRHISGKGLPLLLVSLGGLFFFLVLDFDEDPLSSSRLNAIILKLAGPSPERSTYFADFLLIYLLDDFFEKQSGLPMSDTWSKPACKKNETAMSGVVPLNFPP